MTQATRPNLFVVGAAKAGTTALWMHLDAHPDVFMARPKEPHFFSYGGVSTQKVVKEPRAYYRLFAKGARNRFRGEASPSYLWDPESAERIRQASPDARIIVSLRDPVERAYASYWTHVRARVEPRTFEQAVRDEIAHIDRRAEVDFAAKPAPHVIRGFYDEQLPRYRERFGDAVLVLFFDDLVRDVRGTMRRVYEWLGLDPAPANALDTEPVFAFRLPRHRIVASALAVPGAQRVGEAVVRGKARSLVDRALFTRVKPPLDPELRRLLRSVYAPHDERLRQQLGRPLPWDGRE